MKNQLSLLADLDRHEIEIRAFQLWVSAGRPMGPDTAFWLQAKADVDIGAPYRPAPCAASSARLHPKPLRSTHRRAA